MSGGANLKHTFSAGTSEVCLKENTALNFTALVFQWVTSVSKCKASGFTLELEVNFTPVKNLSR